MSFELSENILFEELGDGVLVMDSKSGTSYVLSGRLAEEFLRVAAGHSVDISSEEVRQLEASGLFRSSLKFSSPSRRAILAGGSGILASGIVAMSMPAAASSASPIPVVSPEVTTEPDPVDTAAGLVGFWLAGGGVFVDIYFKDVVDATTKSLLEDVANAWELTLAPFINSVGAETDVGKAAVANRFPGADLGPGISFNFPEPGGSNYSPRDDEELIGTLTVSSGGEQVTVGPFTILQDKF
jgi:CBS domain-containing protein